MKPSYISGPSETPLLGETIGNCFDRISAAYPERDALISRHQDLRYTYRELHRETEIIARGLMSLGIDRGDRVGVWSPNCAEWLISQYALAKIGAIMVNVNPAYRLRELEHALAQSGVSVLIAARRFRNVSYTAMIEELALKLPVLKTVIYFGADRQGSTLVWEDLIARANKVSARRFTKPRRFAAV